MLRICSLILTCFMPRILFLSGLLLASCAAKPATEPRYIPYDGYGAEIPTVSASYELKRLGESETISVSQIPNALDEFLAPSGSKLILLPNRLDRSRLDFSIESLALVDAWIRDIHTINKLQAEPGRAGESLISDGRGDNSVMLAGLYLGEVIRANSSLDWRWERFDRFVSANPYFTEHYGDDAGLDTFVLVGPQGVATPINTALKRILLGNEESLQFVAELLVAPIDLEAAMSGPNFYGLDRIR